MLENAFGRPGGLPQQKRRKVALKKLTHFFICLNNPHCTHERFLLRTTLLTIPYERFWLRTTLLTMPYGCSWRPATLLTIPYERFWVRWADGAGQVGGQRGQGDPSKIAAVLHVGCRLKGVQTMDGLQPFYT